jgi:hypothetical protein
LPAHRVGGIGWPHEQKVFAMIQFLGALPIDSLVLLFAAVVTLLVFVVGPLCELVGAPLYRRLVRNPLQIWRVNRLCAREHRKVRRAIERRRRNAYGDTLLDELRTEFPGRRR